jgi:hypothetical protein
VNLDLVGTALSALGLGLVVYGVLRSGSWGFVRPKPNAPEWMGVSPVIWLLIGGAVVLLLFLSWENHLIARDKEPLINLSRLRNPVLRGGLIVFMFQYLLQAGLFFVIPLFLSVGCVVAITGWRCASRSTVDQPSRAARVRRWRLSGSLVVRRAASR